MNKTIQQASKDAFFVRGNVIISVLDAQTQKILEQFEQKNLVVTIGRNLIRDLLAGVSGVTGLNYFAIGTDNTVVNASDVTLGTEVFRDQITSFAYAAGRLTVGYYLASGSANGNILAEAGLFGDNATGTSDSGTLFAHVTHPSIVKTASVAVTYSWQINIT